MSMVRARAADRMAREIHEHLAATLPPGLGAREETWERVAPADAAVMASIGAWERGEIGYEELEEAGVRYVEAWQEIAAQVAPSPNSAS